MGATVAPTVLLVEDSLPMARLYMDFLKSEPVTVVHVERGADAFAELAQAVPAVVVLDVRLPDMNGLDILRHIAAEGNDAILRVGGSGDHTREKDECG